MKLVGVIIRNGAGILLFIFWIVEGVFPTLYFIIWGMGLIGFWIEAASSKDD